MAQYYIELRKGAARGTESLAADAMRHLHTRQHLGKAVVVCDHPIGLLSAARKQWLKLSRALQRQRATTLNADKILKYTHAITRMQHMGFSAKTPLDNPDADIYFLSPDKLDVMPVQCWTVYVLGTIDTEVAEALISQLPQRALVVDYLSQTPWSETLHAAPKKRLEQEVEMQWQAACALLKSYKIDIKQLAAGGHTAISAMDDALDTLLGNCHAFLEGATAFQQALEVARPLRLTKERRDTYDAFILLAHRVQALSPGAFGHHFLDTYNEDDTYFLYDISRGRPLTGGESLAAAFARHMAAGRVHLAAAMQRVWDQERPHAAGSTGRLPE